MTMIARGRNGVSLAPPVNPDLCRDLGLTPVSRAPVAAPKPETVAETPPATSTAPAARIEPDIARLSPTTRHALETLARIGGAATLPELGAALGNDKARSLRAQLNRLRLYGFARHDQDRSWTITPAGRALLENWKPMTDAQILAAVAAITGKPGAPTSHWWRRAAPERDTPPATLASLEAYAHEQGYAPMHPSEAGKRLSALVRKGKLIRRKAWRGRSARLCFWLADAPR